MDSVVRVLYCAYGFGFVCNETGMRTGDSSGGCLYRGVLCVAESQPPGFAYGNVLKDAAKWAFLIMAAVAFFCRPFIGGARYAGIFTNPNMFGLYLYVIFAVYMSDLDWSVQRNRPVRKSLLMYVQMALVIFFILLSQARTSTMAAGAILAAWIICRVAVNRKQKTFLPFFKSIGMLIFTAAALFPIFLFGLTHIPTWVGHPIVFQDDVLYLSNGKKIEDIGDRIIKENFPNENVVMEENKKRKDPFEYTIIGRFFKRLDTEDTLNRLSSGRITIYKAYISKQNHLGHKNIALNINGKKVAHAHNNWLQFGYTYGIFAMLFYSIITVLSVWFSCRMYIREFRKKGSYCFLPVAVSVGFFMATLTECLFLPFELFPAFVFWFVFSDLFVKSTPAECR